MMTFTRTGSYAYLISLYFVLLFVLFHLFLFYYGPVECTNVGTCCYASSLYVAICLYDSQNLRWTFVWVNSRICTVVGPVYESIRINKNFKILKNKRNLQVFFFLRKTTHFSYSKPYNFFFNRLSAKTCIYCVRKKKSRGWVFVPAYTLNKFDRTC